MGALMICISDDHPDLMEFITHKSDLNLTTGANMSVKFSDDFFETLKNDGDWVMSFKRPETGEEIIETKKASEIMQVLAETNWGYGEPGILYWDRINKYCLLGEDPSFRYEATNPCVSGDTLILTEYGYIPIKKLVGHSVNIWNGFEWSEVQPMITGQNQPMRGITFTDGTYLRCTEYHKFILSDGTRIEAKDLRPGMKLMKHHFPIVEGTIEIPEKIAYTKGFLAGDGTVSKNGDCSINLFGVKKDLTPFMDYKSERPGVKDSIAITLDKNKYNVIGDKFFVPNAQFTIKTRMSWLAGIIDSDGTLNSEDGSIAITSIHHDFLKEIKFMLNTLGCTGKIGLNKECMYKMMPTGAYDEDGNREEKEYFCRPSYRLVINASNVFKLMQIGFITHRVPLVANPNRDASRFVAVDTNIPSGIEPLVYCFNEPKNHSGVFNGIMTANCGVNTQHSR